MQRRDFLKNAAALAAAPTLLAQKSPNQTIGLAVIGVGTRGYYLYQEFQKIEGVEIRAICDLYDGNLKRARAVAKNDRMKSGKDWEKTLNDPDIDAVVIATPDFWHAPMTIRAAELKKDVYVEKGWCTKLEDAKRMRAAIKNNARVMQLGHNYNSMPPFHKGREIYRSGALGKVAAIRIYIDRTNPWPEWQFFQDYMVTEMPKDASPETIDWERFIANASKRPFNAERFFLWRKWWEYGTGIAGDLYSHLWDGANMIAGLGIPETTVTQGGNYFWKDGRDVPDQWNVIADYPSKEQSVSFHCTFHNRHYGEVLEFLGRDGTLEVAPGFCRSYAAEWKPGYQDRLREHAQELAAIGYQPREAAPLADYSLKPGDLEVSSHWQDFIDCVRSRAMPRCGVDRAFEEAVTIFLSVESYKRNAKVRWDPYAEAIVNC
jgi:predicted dehydrogenase